MAEDVKVKEEEGDDDRIRTEEPHVIVYLDDEGRFKLPPTSDVLAILQLAKETGDDWYIGTDIYGAEVGFKISRIVHWYRYTKEALSASKAEQEVYRRREKREDMGL